MRRGTPGPTKCIFRISSPYSPYNQGMADFDAFSSSHPAVRVHPPVLRSPVTQTEDPLIWPERTVTAVPAGSRVLNSLMHLPVRHAQPVRPRREKERYVGLGRWGHVHMGLQHMEDDLHALAGLFRLLAEETSWPPFLPKVVTYMRDLAADLTESMDRIHAQRLPEAAAQAIDDHVLDLALLPSEEDLAQLGFRLLLTPEQIQLKLDADALKAAWRDHPEELAQTFRQAASELDLIARDLEREEAVLPEAPPADVLPEG